MATAEGGAAANTTSSSYGGGGAGGKFRKKPFRRQTTPYDRPLTALRGNNISENSSSSWLTKLVVEPASKLISYGADRFFASVFRRRLPPPPPSQPPDVNADASDEDQVAGLHDGQDWAQEPRGDDHIQSINSSRSNVVLELEQLLKQKTFNRSEIVHLTELLQSRAVEVSLENASPKNEDTGSDLGRRQEFASALLEGNRNGGNRSSAVVSTPVHNSEVLDLQVLEDDIASPAEVAKAYMGSRPSKVSLSELGMRSHLRREDAGLLITTPFASKSPVMSMTNKTSVGLGAPENGFTTPRSRSRSAIYSMARTPYSRVRPTSILKGSGINNNGHAGPSTASPLSLVENSENFESQPVTLKRRSSVLDDAGGSVGPIRRIRQKSSLLGPRSHHIAHGGGIGSPSNQKPELSREHRNKALTKTIENENDSVPSTSYAPVRSRSSEVGSKILQQLEDLVSKEKSSDSKLAAARGKSPLKSSLDMISGESLRSKKDRGSSKLLLDVHGDDKFGDKTNAIPLDAHDSSPEKQGKLGESDPQTSAIPCIFWNSVLNSDSAVSLKASAPGIGTCDSVVNHEASRPPEKMRAFRDSVELDDVQCNGLASRSLSEKKGAKGSPLTDSNLAPVEAVELVKPTVESKVNSPSSLISSRTNEVRPGAIKAGEGMSVVAIPASEETKATSQSEALASSFAASNKPSEANNPLPLFNFRSKVPDKILSLPMESFRSAEHETGRCSSSNNISVSIGSEVKAAESDKGSRLNLPKPGEINGKCDDVSSPSSNGSIFSSPSLVSFPAASTRDANQASTAGAYLFASSTSITNSVPTGTDTPSTSSDSIFGLATKPSGPDGPIFKFGSSVNPLTAAAPASTTEFVINTSSGSLSSSASSGSSGFGLGSFPHSIGNNLQSSLFASPNKPPLSDAATISEGTSTQLFSSTSAPAFNVSSRSSLPTFGFNSLVSSSSATSFALVGGPTSTFFDIGSSSTAASSSTSASIGIFSSGLSSSSSSSATMTVGLSSGTAPSFFNSVGSSSTPALLNNNSISFTSGTSEIFNFGGSSSASLSSSSSPSTVFGSTFAPPPPSAGFTFGGPSTSCPVFSFTTSSASALSSPSIPSTQPIFGNTPISGGFAASPGNDQMNAEDSMAEDPAPSLAPGFGFGSTVQSQSNPFIFGGQQNQVTPQNLSPPFQATGSLEFNAGGGFSLGSGGGDKSSRKIVKVSRNKNRKK